MNNNNVSIFLPARKGSQRVINKNTRPFSCFSGGLLQLKLSQLIKVSSVSEIIISTNDLECIEIANEFSKNNNKVKVIERPDHLAQSTTSLTDLVKYVPTICNSDHILWTHVTSPFVDALDYEHAINSYFNALKNGYDSLMSVKRYSNFLWSKDKNDIINRVTPQKWPQTQDLEELYEIDSAFFIANRMFYTEKNDRIGLKPELFIQDGFKSFDIDWEDDFSLAETIYEKNIRQ